MYPASWVKKSVSVVEINVSTTTTASPTLQRPIIGDTGSSTAAEQDPLPTHILYTLRPKSANTAIVGLEPSFPPPNLLVPTTTTLCREKQRKLGETSIPIDLVFPELSH